MQVIPFELKQIPHQVKDMLTDPVDDRKRREAAMKSWYWGYNQPPVHSIVLTATQGRDIAFLSDSIRLKTTAPKGERMVY